MLREAGRDADGWVAAVTGRYKLVVDSLGPPWLFDLDEDPDELENVVDVPEKRGAAARLAGALREYGERSGDPRVALPSVRAALERLESAGGD